VAATEFAIVGAGWRAEFFLKAAQELPDLFHVCAVVARNPERAAYIRSKWNVEVVSDIAEIEGSSRPAFFILSLPAEIMPEMMKRLTDKNRFVLAETFPAQSAAAIEKCYSQIGAPALVQIAEQYWRQPVHAARLNIVKSGLLGGVSQAQVSVAHGYHGVSLLRKFLGIGFENCSITGKMFMNKIVKGPDRDGYPAEESVGEAGQKFAVLDFGEKWGVFDFTDEQYFSGIRAPRVLLRGERGELMNGELRYLLDFKTPVEYDLHRVQSGTYGGLGTPHISGINAGDKWYYVNPYGSARLNDDEIAVATVLSDMSAYVNGGGSFYTLAEGSQDQYFSLMMEEAMRTGEKVETSTRLWAK
jgi:hypothetical protein